MGRLRLGTKMSHKHITRKADDWKKTAEERGLVITNALMYNAGLHRALQHELCVCQHGASRHLASANGEDEDACAEIGCECKAFKSSWAQSFGNWRAECWAVLDRVHGIGHYEALFPEDLMHESRLVEAFDGGVKAEAHAGAKAKQATAQAENAAEKANAEA